MIGKLFHEEHDITKQKRFQKRRKTTTPEMKTTKKKTNKNMKEM